MDEASKPEWIAVYQEPARQKLLTQIDTTIETVQLIADRLALVDGDAADREDLAEVGRRIAFLTRYAFAWAEEPPVFVDLDTANRFPYATTWDGRVWGEEDLRVEIDRLFEDPANRSAVPGVLSVLAHALGSEALPAARAAVVTAPPEARFWTNVFDAGPLYALVAKLPQRSALDLDAAERALRAAEDFANGASDADADGLEDWAERAYGKLVDVPPLAAHGVFGSPVLMGFMRAGMVSQELAPEPGEVPLCVSIFHEPVYMSQAVGMLKRRMREAVDRAGIEIEATGPEGPPRYEEGVPAIPLDASRVEAQVAKNGSVNGHAKNGVKNGFSHELAALAVKVQEAAAKAEDPETMERLAKASALAMRAAAMAK